MRQLITGQWVQLPLAERGARYPGPDQKCANGDAAASIDSLFFHGQREECDSLLHPCRAGPKQVLTGDRRAVVHHYDAVWDGIIGGKPSHQLLGGCCLVVATVRSAGPDATDTVVLLGGSTMWGYSAPDAQTIPSLFEAALSRRAWSVHAINLAQISFTSSRSIASLILALRDGLCPVAVVSLDEVNDATVLFRGQQR